MSEQSSAEIIVGITERAEKAEARIAELERERDSLAAQLAVAVEALDNAEAVMSIVEPRSDKAEYLACLQQIRNALASLPDRAKAYREVVEAATAFQPFIKYRTEEFGAHTAELIETVDGLHWSVVAWRLRKALAALEETP